MKILPPFILLGSQLLVISHGSAALRVISQTDALPQIFID
jgi:hypothetical protein